MVETRKVYEAKIGLFTITAEVGYGEIVILSYAGPQSAGELS